MGDDIEFVKLPLEERCTHKLWKARLHGYSEAAKLFEEEEDEKASIFSQFVGMVSKFVGDTNAAAQEKGLEAVLFYVQNAAVAGKTVKDVMSVIVAKCIAAPKAKTKDLAVQIALMYVEIEKQEQVIEELVKGMEHKNPKIVAACACALALCLREFGSKVISIKPIIKPLGSLLEDRDKNVRDETKALAVEIYRWIKDAIKPQLSSLKPIQLTELEAEFEKVKGEKAAPTRFLRSQQVRQEKLAAESEDVGDGDANLEDDTENCNVDPYDLMDPINVLGQISSELYEKLEVKKWQDRKEAVEAIEKVLDYPKFEKGDYSDFVRALLKVITKDTNVMVVGIAVKCMARLALGLKKSFQPYATTVLPQLLEKFKEKKANVVMPLREAVDAIYPVTTLEAIHEDVIAALENKNPAVKAETASFLARCFTKCTPTILSKKLLKAFTTALLKTLNESDPTVRENSAEALGTAMKVVGEKVITPLMPDLDNLKMSKIKECSEKAVVVKAQPVAAAPKAAPKAPSEPKAVRSKSDAAPPKTTPVKANPPKKVASGSKIKKERKSTGPAIVKPTGKKKDEEVDTTPLLPVNNMKHQRILDEQKLKTLKWNFTAPRSEFVDLLKEQMTNAGFNKNLVANMFHSNFKLHLKAIDALSDDLSNVDAVISNLDLILKWMTLRFFDTNPSVVLKGLDYLQNVFALLIENQYSVFDAEANSFMPYLILKIGDPKDAVRDRVRALIKQLSQMYPPGKLFSLVIEGLKSKNARQRTECLEESGNLIEEFGMTVCQPSPAAALKEISRQISDRDHSVRSAALNAIVKAWYIEGDKVYKLIGQISEKDLSLLEERIKRASKARPSHPLPPKMEVKEKSSEIKVNNAYEAPPVEEEEEEEEEKEPYESSPPSPPSTQKHRIPSCEKNVFKVLDPIEPAIAKIDLIEIDDSFLNYPIQIPESIAAKMSNAPSPLAVVKPKEDSEIDQVIRDFSSANINVAFQAAFKLRLILESHVRSLLTAYTDAIMDSLTIQLKLVNSYSFEKYGLILPQTYRMLFRIIDDIFGKKTSMGVVVKVGHLQILLQELLATLVENKTAKFAEGGYNKWINVFVSRIIEDSDHTNITCAVIKMLYDVVGNPPDNPQVTDLTIKCLLKIIVLIKKGNSTWCDMLDLDEVFYECHLFFQAYPRHTWKDRPSIVPLKAIKTLLLTLVGIKGKDIFSYLRKIENPCASELTSYLKRLLKMQPATTKSASNTRLSKAMSEHLSEIFMKIAYEETAKEGLLQFYEFKKQHPNLDLSSFLAPTSQYFRDYVENGLKNIEKEKGALKPSPRKSAEPIMETEIPESSTTIITPEASIEAGAGLAQYYLDKLRVFQARVGIHLPDIPDFKQE